MFKKRNYRRRRGARKPGYRKAVRKAVKTVQNARIKAVVQRVIGRQAETKVSQEYGTLVPITLQAGVTSMNQNSYCITAGSSNFTTASNIIIKGISQGQRIGDEIRVKAHYFNYQMTMRPYNATTNPTPEPVVVKLWWVRPKTSQSLGVTEANYISNLTTSNFFEHDATSECGLAGDMGDLMKKIDRDNYRVFASRTHKLYYAGTLGAPSGVQPGFFGYANNDFNFMATGRIKIKGFNVKFNNSNGNPQNQPIFCIIQVLNADGSIPPSTHQAVDFRFNNAIYFTDI